jgi:hypothetical protein
VLFNGQRAEAVLGLGHGTLWTTADSSGEKAESHSESEVMITGSGLVPLSLARATSAEVRRPLTPGGSEDLPGDLRTYPSLSFPRIDWQQTECDPQDRGEIVCIRRCQVKGILIYIEVAYHLRAF